MGHLGIQYVTIDHVNRHSRSWQYESLVQGNSKLMDCEFLKYPAPSTVSRRLRVLVITGVANYVELRISASGSLEI